MAWVQVAQAMLAQPNQADLALAQAQHLKD